jgi:hypothetical protein
MEYKGIVYTATIDYSPLYGVIINISSRAGKSWQLSGIRAKFVKDRLDNGKNIDNILNGNRKFLLCIESELKQKYKEMYLKEDKNMNYRLLTGYFKGKIVEEVQILDVSFHELPEDLQTHIKLYAGMNEQDDFLNLDEAELYKESYEDSWELEETEDEPNLFPVSNW